MSNIFYSPSNPSPICFGKISDDAPRGLLYLDLCLTIEEKNTLIGAGTNQRNIVPD